MQLLCPSCRTPLPATPPGRAAVLTCDRCSAEVDVSRAGTAAGRPRFVPEIDRTGDAVGGYVLEARIGAGGMGTVYRARRPGDTGSVAVKFLSPALASEPEVVARFHREVKLLRSLTHPSIVRVVDHGDEAGVPWFAMELVEGPDLRARLAKGALPVEELGPLFGRLFDALAHAHARGVIHRDLKPANVLLAADGAKLADFGIARPDPESASHATKLTETAAILGTFPYMSPEQRAGAEVDRRSDLFSAGVLLYEAATGKLPQGAFAPPSRVNPALPARLDPVVSKLLQPDREARFATAEDAALALREAFRPRASMAPVIGFGAVAAVTLALVMPSVMSRSGTAKKVPATGGAAAPVRTPAASAAMPPASGEAADGNPLADHAGNVNGIVPASVNAEPNVSAPVVRKLAEEQAKKPRTPARGDDDDRAQGGSTALSPEANRVERNLVQQLENQAASASIDAAVGMIAACGPTLVYADPNRKSKVLTRLAKGHRIDRLKVYRRFAALLPRVLGIGAGLAAPEPAKSKSRKPDDVQGPPAVPQAMEPEPQAIPQGQVKTPEEVWLFVRYSEKDERGWIAQECAAETRPDAPAYGTGDASSDAAKRRALD